MKQQFEAILTGTDSKVIGMASKINFDGFDDAYEFESIDDNLHLVIAKDDEGHWVRVAGSEPWLSGWVEELAEQIL